LAIYHWIRLTNPLGTIKKPMKQFIIGLAIDL